MSRSKKYVSKTPVNPIELHLFFNGNTGKWGQMPGGSGQKEIMPFVSEFQFTALDLDFFRVKTNEAKKKKAKPAISSTYGHYGLNPEIVIFPQGGTLAEAIFSGKWQDAKKLPVVTACEPTYILMVICHIQIDGVDTLAAIHLHGRALSAFVEFRKEKDLYSNLVVRVTGTVKVESDDFAESLVPVFEAMQYDYGDNENELLADMDAKFQSYLHQYFGLTEIPAELETESETAKEAAETDGEPEDETIPDHEPEPTPEPKKTTKGKTGKVDDLPFD